MYSVIGNVYVYYMYDISYIPIYIHTQAHTIIPTNRKPGFMGHRM